MKKRISEDGSIENEKLKLIKIDDTEESIKDSILKDLPNVLIKLISSYLDIDSLLNFSSTNQKYKNLFQEFRNGYLFFNQSGFIARYRFDEETLNQIRKHLSETEEKEISPKQIFGEILLKKKFSIFNYKSPLLFYLNKTNKPKIEMIKYLVENNCDLKIKNKYHETPLHIATTKKNPKIEILKYFIENKCEINEINVNNDTPLHYACKNQSVSLKVLKFLFEINASFNLLNKSSETPLHFAFLNESASFKYLKYIIENNGKIFYFYIFYL
jgi:hypothetical protein